MTNILISTSVLLAFSCARLLLDLLLTEYEVVVEQAVSNGIDVVSQAVSLPTANRQKRSDD